MKSAEGFALDVQGLDRLRNSAHLDPHAGLKEASKQFEALFLQMMLKSMRAAVPKSEMSNNSQTEMYTEMLDQQWAQSLAGKGIGLAEQLTRQLSGYTTRQSPELDSATSAFLDLPPARPSPFASPAFDAWKRREVSGADKDQPEHVQAFIARLSEPAQKAARSSGVPAELILAQAALETDWGRRTITTAGGADSHNLFGIKAGQSWQGGQARAITSEFRDGAMVKETAQFRSYDSYQDSFHDLVTLLQSNDRYKEVVKSADNPEQFVRELQKAGYATDPDYASKISQIAKTMNSYQNYAVAGATTHL